MQVKMTLLFLALLAVLASPASSRAQTQSAKGMATITPADAAVSPGERGEAIRKACVNAMDRWFAETNQAQVKNWETSRSRILASLDEYLLSTTVLSEESDAAAREFRVVVRVEINALRLDNALQGAAAVSSAGPSERSMLAFVFVAREPAAVKQFAAQVHVRQDTSASGAAAGESAHAGSESEAISRRTVQTAESQSSSTTVSAETSASQTTGGSVTQKTDEMSWRVANAAEVNTVVTGLFTTAGFEVYEAEMLEGETGGQLSTQAFKDDYSRGEDLAPATLSSAVKALQGLGVKYLALGKMDSGLVDKDQVTGLERVHVTVTAKVYDLSGRFARSVASVGPELHAGLGPDRMVARTNALEIAAKAAGDRLLNELNSKGVR